jgi:hypothetical protein
VNVLQQIALDNKFSLMFLPKFHCEMNWAELYWCTMKTYVRSKVDGKLGTMHKALWSSYGNNVLPTVLMRRFSRKVREIIHLYQHEVDGPFAVYCQKKFSRHRMSFINALALKRWAEGAKATCAKCQGGKKKVFCTVHDINEEIGTCTAKFGTTLFRHGVPLEELSALPESSVYHAS